MKNENTKKSRSPSKQQKQLEVVLKAVTETKPPTASMAELAENYLTILENSLNGTVVVDAANAKILFANKAALKLHGFNSLEEVSEANLIDYIHPDDKERAFLAFAKDFFENTPHEQYEFRTIAKDGSGKRVLSYSVPIQYQNKLCGVISFVDITERKKAEEALKKSEEYFKEITENSSDMIIITDKNGDVKYCSGSVERCTGYKPEELIGKSTFAFIHPDDLQRAVSDFGKSILAKETAIPNAFRMVHKDGSVRYFDGLGKNLLDNPSIAGFIMNIRDVTEHKKMENALSTSEGKLRAMFESMSEAATITDMSGRIIEANPAAVKLHRYHDKKELIGISAAELVAGRDRNRAIKDSMAALKTNQTKLTEYKLTTKGGTLIDGEFCTAVIRDSSGNPAGFIGISRDISDRKRMEEKLRENERKLETIFHSIMDGLIITDMMGTVMDANAAAVHIGKYNNLEDLIGRSGMDFVAESERKRVGKTLIAAIADTKKAHSDIIEYTAQDKNGNPFYGETSVAVIRDSSGKPTGLIFVTRDISERKRLEDKIRGDEEKLSAIFESMSDCLVITDDRLHIVNVNDGGTQLTGFTKEELIGRNAIEMLDKSDLDRAIKSLENRRTRGDILKRGDFKVRIKDGSLRDVNINISNLNDVSGKLIGFVCVIRDITDHKKIEEALRTSEERLRAVYASLADALVITDKNLIMIDCNDMALKLGGGYSRDQIIGRLGTDILHENDRQRAIDELAKRFMGQVSPERQDYRIKTVDGSIRYTEMSIATLKDVKEEIIGFVAVLRDTTERRQMEEAIHSSQKLLSAIFESLRDGIVVVDKDINFTQWNQAAIEISGFKAEEMLGKPGIEIVIPEDRQRLMEELAKQFMGTAAERQSYRVQLPGGVLKHIELSISALKDNAGNITGFVTAIRDVTKRIAMERELKKALDDLQRSNKELEQFAYVASHDLQEPLRMVSSYTQLLSKRYKGKLDTDADEFIGYAVDGADRMQKMIQDLLVYSRVTTRGKDFEPVDLEKAFNDAIDNLKIAIEENKATITHDPLPKVMADESQMIRLLQNLIGNALKFHGAEPPIIRVGCKDGEFDYTISIKDNGIGIDKQYFNRLFTIFQRLHTRDQYPGTGIGLAVCKRTVERHGGAIWVESEGAGKGTTFAFTIPKRDLTKK